MMGSPLYPASAAPVSVNIYNGEGTDGTLLGTANGMTPATGDFNAFEYVAFDLSSSNIKVVAGQLYTIQLTTSIAQTAFLSLSNSNTYADGQASLDPDWDFVFKTNVRATSTDSYLPLSGGALTGNLSTSGAISVGAGTSSISDGLIVGAASTSVTSAALEVQSTTQGFLPPRMSGAQRDAISSKVAGLVVWCSNCGSNGELQVFNGTTWTNMIGGDASLALVVGMEYQGGKIAYILQSVDPGYDPKIPHGIIAATSNQGQIKWHNVSNTTTGAIG
jgi:hypothetical protein